MSGFNVSLIIQAIDRATGPLRRVNAAVEAITEPARRVGGALAAAGRDSGMPKVLGAATGVGKALGDAAGQAARLGLKLAALGGGAGFLFKTQLLDVASQFERFQTILETVEGSSEKAKTAMSWVSDFAVETPYELDQVMEAFVRLRAYGLDPTNGLLQTLGDTSAAMGKPLMQAVEAVADAMTGENERLKEFGIKAQTSGKRIVYEYSANGKTMRKEARVGNRAMIQEVLTAIWNEKYAGAMGKLSETWSGMVSNLSDQWSRAALMIMDTGVFEWLKGRLAQILATIDAWAKDGRLLAWAQQVGQRLTEAFEGAWRVLPQVWDAITGVASAVAWLADVVGGWRNLAIAVAALMAGPLLSALVSVGMAVWSLGVALMATPVGWFLAAAAAIAGTVYLIYRNWDGIAGWFGDLWAAVVGLFDSAVGAVMSGLEALNPIPPLMRMIDQVRSFLSGIDLAALIAPKVQAAIQALLPDWAIQLLGGGSGTRLAAPAPTVQRSAAAAEVGGVIKVEILGAPTRVREVKSTNRRVDLDVDTGWMMAGAGG